MKYKLKINLPFAKAGTEVKLLNSTLPHPNITFEMENNDVLKIWYQDKQKLLEEGWIEEVKSREFYIEVDNLGHPQTVQRKDTIINHSADYELIKVREVTE